MDEKTIANLASGFDASRGAEKAARKTYGLYVDRAAEAPQQNEARNQHI